MKTIETRRNHRAGQRAKVRQSWAHELRKSKDAIFAESRASLKSQERILSLALNEAEALAWETLYPHLVFPGLAAEKVQEVTHWVRHQRAVRRLDPTVVLAA